MERRDFETLGNKIAEHSRAVAEWIVDQGGSAVPGARVGTDWLKSNADCGITTGVLLLTFLVHSSLPTTNMGQTQQQQLLMLLVSQQH